MRHIKYQPKHRATKEVALQERGSSSGRLAAYIAAIGVTLGGAAVVTSLEDEPKQPEKVYVDTNRECRQAGFQEIPYDINSGKLNYLVRQIKTIEHEGPLQDNPCYDEALTIVKQQTAEGYPYYGEVILPKFLIPQGMTRHDIKAQ